MVEAAQSMGASPFQIMTKVLLQEAKPSLLVGAAISITTILGYSAMEMLAEPIIRKLGTSFPKKWARRFGILCGVGFLTFGFVSKRTLILPLMLILPLLLKLPEYFVMEQENILVDLLGVKTQRAAALSILNMGVSIMEILALFASAVLTAVGIGWCFIGVGVLLIICMLCIFVIDNQ